MTPDRARAVKPMADRVLVEVDPDHEQVSKGGIIVLTTGERSEALRATVLAVGPGKRAVKGPLRGQRLPMTLSPGDRVLLEKDVGVVLSKQPEILMVKHEEMIPVTIDSEQAGEIIR